MFDAEPAKSDLSAEAEEWSLPGLELLHDMHFMLAAWGDWDDLARRLQDAGAEFVALTMAQQAEGVSVRCRLTRLSPALARALCATFREDGSACQAGVEHLMLRR